MWSARAVASVGPVFVVVVVEPGVVVLVGVVDDFTFAVEAEELLPPPPPPLQPATAKMEATENSVPRNPIDRNVLAMQPLPVEVAPKPTTLALHGPIQQRSNARKRV
ncbi:MAG TPA: hypothetical protein VFF73_18425 [Planctomycetota bacterium]|nr:hypothetical protein [Planctomycetota bacterium]